MSGRPPVRVAVMASGGGTNLQSLLVALNDPPASPARVIRVVSNRADAPALERARRAGVDAVPVADPADPAQIIAALGDAELVVLAGYLKLIPAEVVSRFRWRMVNIHPALLPDFGGPGMYGVRVHQAVLAAGAQESGASVHYVTEEFDRGAVIAQARVPVHPGDTPDALAARVLAAEHRLLPRVVTALARLGLPSRAVRLEDTGT